MQFSLLALLFVITAACFLVAWLAQPDECEAVALFRVSAVPPRLAENQPAAFDAREFELLQDSHLELIHSHVVLRAAVRNPAIAKLTLLSARNDPVEWLAENIEAEFLQESEILSIRLRGPASKADEIRQIADAVAKAYQEEVVYDGRQRQLIARDAKARSVAELQNELEEKMRKRQAIVSESGGSENVDAKLLQLEIDVLIQTLRELALQLEQADIEAEAPDRIQLIQPAVVTY